MSKILINDMLLDVENYEIDCFESEPTSNKLTKIKFETTVIGKEKKDSLLETIEKKVLLVRFDEKNIEMKAKKGNNSFSYNGNEQNEDTVYNFEIIINELDKDLPEEWNAQSELYIQVMMNWMRTRAISELLLDKGIITNNEYNEKIKKVMKRDYDDLKNYILYGIPEPNKNEK